MTLEATEGHPDGKGGEAKRWRSGASASTFYVGPEKGAKFHSAISRAAADHPADHPVGRAVEVKPVEAYQGGGLALFNGSLWDACVAVTDYGDLVGVFKHPDSESKINDLLGPMRSSMGVRLRSMPTTSKPTFPIYTRGTVYTKVVKIAGESNTDATAADRASNEHVWVAPP